MEGESSTSEAIVYGMLRRTAQRYRLEGVVQLCHILLLTHFREILSNVCNVLDRELIGKDN